MQFCKSIHRHMQRGRLKYYPELSRFTPDRAIEILQLSEKEAQASARFGLNIILIFWIGLVAFLYVSDHHKLGYSIPCSGSLTLPFIIVIHIFRYYKINARVRERVIAEIESRCLNCGYDLRATPARCPECGGTVMAKLSQQD